MTAPFKLRLPRLVALIALLALGVHGSSWAAATAKRAAAPKPPCQCEAEERKYVRKPTSEVKQLFTAARLADEATFARLIKTIPDIQEYAIEGVPLLHALLSPVAELAPNRPGARVEWEQSAEESARLRAVHRASLPAKTRMLALALERGASVKDVTYQSRHSPLHLAMVFGTPEMIRLLLKHGANPNQSELFASRSPIEFALDDEMFVRMTYLPSLVDKAQRTEMILDLLAADSSRPYRYVDEMIANKEEEEDLRKALGGRPAADHLLWPALIELTEGAAVLDAMEKTGTRPVFDADNADLSPLAHAARAGNVDALKWLKAKAPRRIDDAGEEPEQKKTVDLWVSAAAWALYPRTNDAVAQERREKILRELLVSGMLWEQRNELRDDTRNALISHTPEHRPRFGDTLMHHLAVSGRTEWVEWAVRLGAPVDGVRKDGRPVSQTPLLEAVHKEDAPMVKQLLALGADPLAAPEGKRSPLDEAIAPDSYNSDANGSNRTDAALTSRRDILTALMATMTAPQKAALSAAQVSPLTRALDLNGKVDPALVRLLLKAGLSAAALDGHALVTALRSDDPSLVVDLLDHGAVVREGASATGENTASSPLLVEAVLAKQAALLPRLLKAGANPNARAAGGYSAVEWAIVGGDQKTLDVLLAHDGRIAVDTSGRAPEAASSLDLAIASGNDAMLRRVKALWPADLSSACLPSPALLVPVVLDSTDAYWNSLMGQGLGQPGAADHCAGQSPMAVRLVGALLESPDRLQVGWRDARLTARLKDLWGPAGAGGMSPLESERWLQTAREQGREDVVRALLQAGVKDTPIAKTAKPRGNNVGKPTARDKALAKQMRGHYYLTEMREVGSEILLSANGQFQFGLAYGAANQMASGTWTVRDNRVLFRTSYAAPKVKKASFQRISQATPAADIGPGHVSVRAVFRERDVPEINITLMGCQAPQMTRGQTTDEGWNVLVPESLCQIVLQHPQLDRGRPFVYHVANATDRNFVFEMEQPDASAGSDFNVDMRIDNGALVWERGGRLLTYTRN